MINIKVKYDPEEDCVHSDGQMEIIGRKTAVNEVAAIFTMLFRAIPRHELLEGLMASELGQDVDRRASSKS